MSFMKIAAVLAAALMLPACAGGWIGGPQQHAGIETLRVKYELATLADGSESPYIKDVYYRSGKETNMAQLVFELPDGTKLNFDTDLAKAFEGQALRAEVERVVAEQVGDVAPGVVDAIIKALTGGISP